MNEGINILQNMQDELELQETEAETEDQESDWGMSNLIRVYMCC